MSGVVPPELAQLAALENLFLGHNLLSGARTSRVRVCV
jgi:hypothetical protein